MTGGAMPALGELAAYQANHAALFRDAPLYGWVNMKSFIDLLGRKPVERKDSSAAPDPMPMPDPEKIIGALGLAGLKTIAFKYQDSNEGDLFQVLVGAPEASRSGLPERLAAEPKDTN